MKNDYLVIGVMSGTSLDGLDLALCHFNRKDGNWFYDILKANTIPYDHDLKQKLGTCQNLSARDFVALHRSYGRFIGEKVKAFSDGVNKIDFIASHGHTVFHEPEKQITFQIGCGAQIVAHSGIKTISDFRTLDIALGGHGAPLVPIGDELLFHSYDACINLGGFANISYKQNQFRIAYDICPVNIVLNELCELYFHQSYDKEGELGRQGKVIPELLNQLNNIAFYKLDAPKSLAREWVENQFNPIIKPYLSENIIDVLTTCYHHFAEQIAHIINQQKLNMVLFTGGGTFNSFFMELIKSKCSADICIPDSKLINYKEALIFAFLGVLRDQEEVNCLKSVTGAKKDNCGGSVFMA